MAGNKSSLQRLLSCLHIPRRATQHGATNGTAIPLVPTVAPAATGQPPPPAGGGAHTAPQQQPQPQQQNQPPSPHAPPAQNPAPAVLPTAPGNRPAQVVRRPGLTYEFPLIGTNVDPWLVEPYLNARLGGQENYQFWPELDRLTLRTNRLLTQVGQGSFLSKFVHAPSSY
ncbi:hypothetical protein V8F33_010511 [Rhypophila sp. PSN 637]